MSTQAARFGEELASAKKMLAAGLAGGDRSLDKADKALAIGVGKLREPLAMKHTGTTTTQHIRHMSAGPDSILVEGPFNASAPVKPWSAALPG